MSNPLQLNGVVPDVDDRDAIIADLQRENKELRRELATVSLAAKHEAERVQLALGALRRQLQPLYQALRMVFGEIEAAGVKEEYRGENVQRSRPAAAWDEWKQRLGPGCAKVIDALLLGGDMNVEAIKIAASMGRQSVYDATSKMGRAGILVKNGGKFSLKQL